jgi:hypothetical protein
MRVCIICERERERDPLPQISTRPESGMCVCVGGWVGGSGWVGWCVCVCVCVCVYPYTRTQTHTHTHPNTQTHIYTHASLSLSVYTYLTHQRTLMTSPRLNIFVIHILVIYILGNYIYLHDVTTVPSALSYQMRLPVYIIHEGMVMRSPLPACWQRRKKQIHEQALAHTYTSINVDPPTPPSPNHGPGCDGP